MARATGYMITYDDANYMIANEGFTLTGTYTTGLNCMNRSEIEAYMNADTSYFSAYATNRLVPYNLLHAVANTAPTFPTALTSSTQTSTSITMNWVSTDDVGVTSQVLWWGTTAGGTTNSTTLSASATSYTLTGLNASTSYTFYILASDVEAFSTASNSLTQSTVAPDTEAPSVPQNVSAVQPDPGVGSIAVSWNASTDNVGVDHYNVWRSINNASYVLTTEVSTSVTVSANDGESDRFQIAAVDAAGNTSALSTTVYITVNIV